MSYSMETIIINIAINTTVVLLSLFMGDKWSIVLPRLSRLFDRKPFNCRPCFTFHLHWLGMAVIALIFQSWTIALSGVITAFLVFGVIKYKESKIISK